MFADHRMIQPWKSKHPRAASAEGFSGEIFGETEMRPLTGYKVLGSHKQQMWLQDSPEGPTTMEMLPGRKTLECLCFIDPGIGAAQMECDYSVI